MTTIVERDRRDSTRARWTVHGPRTGSSAARDAQRVDQGDDSTPDLVPYRAHRLDALTGQDLTQVRPIRDEIERRVRVLLDSLEL